MTIYRTAYDTSIGSSVATNKIITPIQQSFIRGLLSDTNLDIITSLKIKPVFITGGSQKESEIPIFVHSILVKNKIGQDEEGYLCTDVRPFLKIDRKEYEIKGTNEIIVRNQTEFNLAKSRAILTLAWVNNEYTKLRNNLGFAGHVFASWLSDVIAKRFALDPNDQMTLFIVCHYYYMSLFEETDEFDETTKERFAIHTIKATKMPSKYVFDIFNKIEKMSSIDDLCSNIKNVLTNVRLKDLSAGFIVTLVGNSWYGLNSKEMLAIALEHPPTWIAIVYTAMVERTFKNSSIARIAEKVGKGNAGADFTKMFVELVHSYTVKVEGRYSAEELQFKPFD